MVPSVTPYLLLICVVIDTVGGEVHSLCKTKLGVLLGYSISNDRGIMSTPVTPCLLNSVNGFQCIIVSTLKFRSVRRKSRTREIGGTI